MSALCAIHPLPEPALGQFEARDALLFIAAVPIPQAHLLAWSRSGPLDERSVRLALDPTCSPHACIGKRATLVWPIRLADGEVIHETLAQGPITLAKDHEQSRQHRVILELLDEGSADLARSHDTAFIERAGTLALTGQPTSLRAGSRANRSGRRWPLHGTDVYLPSDAAHPWTLGQAIETLLAFHGIALDGPPAPPGVAHRPLSRDVDLLAPLRDALEPLLKEHGLRLLVHPPYMEGASHRGARVSDARAGKLVSGLHGLEVSRQSMPGDRRLTRWRAIGSPWEHETTQQLAPAWGPHEAGLPDASYSTGHPDFIGVSHVFRRWLLNEDGRDPMLPRPDLRSVIGERLAQSPLPWLARLPRGAGGVRPPPLIESSLDGGASWTPWAGPAQVLTRHAGVALQDEALPPAFIAACRSGSARIRVTGCLQGGAAVAAELWTGDAHAGRAPDVELNAPTTLRFQRIDPAAAAGASPPTPIDDRPALASWLLDRATAAEGAGLIRLTLAGAHPLLAPGDRYRWGAPGEARTLFLIQAVRITDSAASGTVTELELLPESAR